MLLFVDLMTTWQQYVLVEYMLCMLSFGSIFYFCFFLVNFQQPTFLPLAIVQAHCKDTHREEGNLGVQTIRIYNLLERLLFHRIYHSLPPPDRKTLKLTLPLSAMLDLSSISPILNGPKIIFYPFLVSF